MAMDKEEKGKGSAKGTHKLKVVADHEVSTLCLPILCPLPSNCNPKVISPVKMASWLETPTAAWAIPKTRIMERWPNLCVTKPQSKRQRSN